jgi:hypothetical protein
MACSFQNSFWNCETYRQLLWHLELGHSPSLGRYLHRKTHPQKETQIYINATSKNRTHDPSIRADKDTCYLYCVATVRLKQQNQSKPVSHFKCRYAIVRLTKWLFFHLTWWKFHFNFPCSLRQIMRFLPLFPCVSWSFYGASTLKITHFHVDRVKSILLFLLLSTVLWRNHPISVPW